MMKFSFFTPTHNPRFLKETYESLKQLSYSNWEWVVLPNNGGLLKFDPLFLEELKQDFRVVLLNEPDRQIVNIGEAKALCCDACTGDVYVELDHDDLSASRLLTALEEVYSQHPEVGFVYTRSSQINADRSPNYDQWGATSGWTYDTIVAEGESLFPDGTKFISPKHQVIHPHNMSIILFQPNHARSFRAETYKKIGGYNRSLKALDDQDLICRMYLETEFFAVDEVLYFQRVNAENSQNASGYREFINQNMTTIQQDFLPKMMLKWCQKNNLKALDLGARHNKTEGYLAVDQFEGDGVDVVGDIFEVLRSMPDNSVGIIRAKDFLEHISDKIALWKEFYRVLAHGGMVFSMTPSSDGRGAFQDPTHVAYYNPNSFWYFTNKFYRDFVKELGDIRFQENYIDTVFPSDFNRVHNIPYVIANLTCIKDNEIRFGGFLKI